MRPASVPEELWDHPAAACPPPRLKGGHPPDRLALAGILYVLGSGIPWRLPPAELGCGRGSPAGGACVTGRPPGPSSGCIMRCWTGADLELTGEAEAGQAAGLAFVRIPLPDRGVPDRQAVQPALDALAAELATGRHVVVHCRYGIGRASLLAGALLVREGWDPEQAWAELSRVRGYRVPDTDQQRTWLAVLNAQPPEPF